MTLFFFWPPGEIAFHIGAPWSRKMVRQQILFWRRDPSKSVTLESDLLLVFQKTTCLFEYQKQVSIWPPRSTVTKRTCWRWFDFDIQKQPHKWHTQAKVISVSLKSHSWNDFFGGPRENCFWHGGFWLGAGAKSAMYSRKLVRKWAILNVIFFFFEEGFSLLCPEIHPLFLFLVLTELSWLNCSYEA